MRPYWYLPSKPLLAICKHVPLSAQTAKAPVMIPYAVQSIQYRSNLSLLSCQPYRMIAPRPLQLQTRSTTGLSTEKHLLSPSNPPSRKCWRQASRCLAATPFVPLTNSADSFKHHATPSEEVTEKESAADLLTIVYVHAQHCDSP
jgi:hypothetical protein